MVNYVPPLCLTCKHYHDKLYKALDKVRCDAFPEGIPKEIYVTSEIDHTEPVEGDNGIQYEERDGE